MDHSFQNIELLSDIDPPTLFLPGWGFDGKILQLLKPAPHWIYPENLLDPASIEEDMLHLLNSNNIKKVRLVGWSMGAMLGLKFAAKHPDLVDSLLLASLRSHWPEQEISDIRKEYSQDPKAFLKGFYRKCFLGDKQAYRNFSANLEPLYLAAIKENCGILERGLNFLGTYTIPIPFRSVRTRILHGRQDIIAPVKEMPILPGSDVEVIDNAGHVVFLHEDCSLQHELRKQVIQVKFSRAADSYDNFAKVQMEVARRLAARLIRVQKESYVNTILEIGCGTGNFTSLLAERFPAAKIVALDFSPEMIARAQSKLNNNNIEFVCAEGEQFLEKTAHSSFDLVVSNGSLQWFSNIGNALYHIARILTPGGSMFCSIFGPESLKELDKGLHAIQTLAAGIAAQAFPQEEQLQNALNNNFQDGRVEEELITKEYESAHDLLLHIKKTGTSGWRQKMQQPLTPVRVKMLDEWFEKNLGSCKVTYQVLYLQGNI
jgi:malonyl-CoA O-methyltransferase